MRTELLGNPLARRERKDLERLLNSLPTVGTDASHFARAGELKARLAEEGTLITARDAHILQCAIDRGALLLSRDPLFRTVELSTGVKVQM